ncbi:MAG: tRNA (guanosine(46)-N7)-methyltransferase TrmB [Geminicoccaceae bacterium]|nr:tRNA (guanosine(46)-N7)-methyltransferase TrmB [Geminicoccaceae bacterium]
MEAPASDGRRQVYGRRAVRLRAGQRERLETLLPRLRVGLPEAGGRLDPARLFPSSLDDLWLEVGFGGGEHLAGVARDHPGVGILGVEPFVGGVAKLLRSLEAEGSGNVRIVVDDARLVLDALPDFCLGRAYVLFPDPWPKLRQQKRRIVNPRTAAAFARLLRPGAELRLATDDPDYGRFMLETLLAEPRFDWRAEGAPDWRLPWPGWHRTRYQEKAEAAGRPPLFLRFTRRQAPASRRKETLAGRVG